MSFTTTFTPCKLGQFVAKLLVFVRLSAVFEIKCSKNMKHIVRHNIVAALALTDASMKYTLR